MKRIVENGITKAAEAWFNLTSQERTTTIIVVAIFLLGAITRWVLRGKG